MDIAELHISPTKHQAFAGKGRMRDTEDVGVRKGKCGNAAQRLEIAGPLRNGIRRVGTALRSGPRGSHDANGAPRDANGCGAYRICP